MDAERLPKKPKDEEVKLKFSWKPKPILSGEITCNLSLEKSFIGVLKSKKDLSKAISCLGPYLPRPQHLKRCSGLRIYLAPIERTNGNQQELKDFLNSKGFDLNMLEEDFEIADVVTVAPKTKSQMTYATQFWPVNFHPDLTLEAQVSGTMFNEQQLFSLEKCMRLAINAAEDSAIGSDECNGSALILDPQNGKILSIASSSIDKHPMWHAAMLAIDLVAKYQGGGAWKLVENFENLKADDGKRKLELDLPLHYPSSLDTLKFPQNDSLIFMRKDQKKKDEKLKSIEKHGPYLCTGYWAVLLQEPCPICAMALLHSRVTTIFYGVPNPTTGILGSNVNLHSVPGLNHRFQVWSSVLQNECSQTLEKCRKFYS